MLKCEKLKEMIFEIILSCGRILNNLEKKADARLVKAKGKKPKRASAGAEDGVPAKKKKKKKVSVD